MKMTKILLSTCLAITASIGITNAQFSIGNTGTKAAYPGWGYTTASGRQCVDNSSGRNNDGASYWCYQSSYSDLFQPLIVSPGIVANGSTNPTFNLTFWVKNPNSGSGEADFSFLLLESPIELDPQTLANMDWGDNDFPYEAGDGDITVFQAGVAPASTNTNGTITFNGTTWVEAKSTIHATRKTGYYYLAIAQGDASGPYLIDDINITSSATGMDILPVKYAQPLTATMQGLTVYLNWATATEINNRGFNIQHSADGKTFTDIGFVASQAANGNSTKTLSYTYTDAAPLQGKNYYRLAQEDLDGKSTPSGIVSVDFSGAGGELSVYPNPAHGSVTVSGLQAGNNVAVYSASGQLVKRFVSTAASQQVDISRLAVGVYFVKVLNGNGKASASFIVK